MQVIQKLLNILLSSSVSHVFKRLLIDVTQHVCGTHWIPCCGSLGCTVGLCIYFILKKKKNVKLFYQKTHIIFHGGLCRYHIYSMLFSITTLVHTTSESVFIFILLVFGVVSTHVTVSISSCYVCVFIRCYGESCIHIDILLDGEICLAPYLVKWLFLWMFCRS